MADKNTVKDLLTDEIKDLYSAEKQLTKAIPKMAKGSNDPSLKEAFSAHLKETPMRRWPVSEEAGQLLGIKVTGKKCVMEGCIEGAEALEEEGEDNILDLGIINRRKPCRALRDGRISDRDQPRQTYGRCGGCEFNAAVAGQKNRRPRKTPPDHVRPLKERRRQVPQAA